MEYIERAVRKVVVTIFNNRVPVRAPVINIDTEVPKTMHFVYGLWDSDEIPSVFLRNIDLWLSQGWKIKLWGRGEVEDLLKRYPDVEGVYYSLSRNIQRADLARYIIVYDQGGFYSDCDCSPKRFSLMNMLMANSKSTSFFFIEDYLAKKIVESRSNHFMRKVIPEFNRQKICNYLFGAVAGCEIVKKCINESVRRCQLFNNEFIDDLGVIITTGPEVTTDIIQDNRDKVLVKDNTYFCDHGCSGAWRNGGCNEILVDSN